MPIKAPVPPLVIIISNGLASTSTCDGARGTIVFLRVRIITVGQDLVQNGEKVDVVAEVGQ